MADNDPQEFNEFDNLVDESGSEVFAEPEAKSSGRGGRKIVFYLVLLLFVAAGAGAAWFLLFDKPAPAPIMAAAPSPAPSPEPAAPATDTALPPDVSATPSPTADATTETAAAVPTEPGLPAPAAAPPADETAAPLVSAEAMPAPPAPAAVETPVETVPAAPVAEVAPAMPASEAVETVSTTTTTETTTQNPAGVAAPTSPADTERLTQLEAQIQTMATELAAAKQSGTVASGGSNAADPAIAAQLKALTDKIEEIGQQVTALDERTTTLATQMQNAGNSDVSAPVERLAPVEKPKAEKPKTVKAPARKPPARRASASPGAAGWELRSATPEAAWLGKAGGSEMARYAVGQTVPGLGTIQSVSQENGRWVVKTSGGTIRE